jgi:hypothetical protein
VAFLVEDSAAGKDLYAAQEDVFSGCGIFVGVDLVTGYFHVEGSGLLWDELYAFRGLDAMDIQNYVCVAQYILCLKRFGLLEDTVNPLQIL